MTTPEHEKSWQERFDETLKEIEDMYYDNDGNDDGFDKVVKYLKSNENKLFNKRIYPETFFELDPEKVKSFIQELIKEEKLGLLEEIEQRYKHSLSMDIIQEIREKIEKGEL